MRNFKRHHYSGLVIYTKIQFASLTQQEIYWQADFIKPTINLANVLKVADEGNSLQSFAKTLLKNEQNYLPH